MLSEDFIAAIGPSTKTPTTNVAKDAAIFIQEFQPLSTQKAVLKKSATPPKCLAISKNHIFAAQHDKGVVHVYSREKNNQEATVPFTERIHSIALACNDTVLVLGSAEGRIFLWETATGRQITSNQAHVQAVTALAVDASSNFLLSASADSTVHTWSIPALLSFANVGDPASPLSTFTSHRSEVTGIVLGHSTGFCNIAASISSDRTCSIWDYHSNSLLRTYLLPAKPLCVEIDAADRAVYVGFEDGSIQQLDFYDTTSTSRSIHASKDGTAPVQAPRESHWKPADALVGATLSITLSFDSSILLTGHQSGAILAWDVGRQSLRNTVTQAPLPGPVTNLRFLPVTGYEKIDTPNLEIKTVIKPKFGAFDSSDGCVPGNYTFRTELRKDLESQESDFYQALTASHFPTALIDQSLSELATWANAAATEGGSDYKQDDFMALDDRPLEEASISTEEANKSLRAEIEALRRLQSASFRKFEKVNAERKALIEKERRRLEQIGKERQNGALEKV